MSPAFQISVPQQTWSRQTSVLAVLHRGLRLTLKSNSSLNQFSFHFSLHFGDGSIWPFTQPSIYFHPYQISLLITHFSYSEAKRNQGSTTSSVFIGICTIRGLFLPMLYSANHWERLHCFLKVFSLCLEHQCCLK